MKKFRITKYNPSFRNERGEYILDEWTSIYDIGKKFYDGILTEQAYFEKEHAYIQAIELLLMDNDLRSMHIVQLEKNTHEDLYKSLTNNEKKNIENMEVGMSITHNDIKSLCKMILRELVWAKLESPNGLLTIEFGYDYYMYAICNEIDEKTKEKILKSGLFVEDMGKKD